MASSSILAGNPFCFRLNLPRENGQSNKYYLNLSPKSRTLKATPWIFLTRCKANRGEISGA